MELEFAMLNNQIIVVLFLTFVINFIGISCLATRIVGTRTGKLASSSSLFNIILLISQFASSFQAPLLTKFVETGILNGNGSNDGIFRLIIFSATIGSLLGGISIPTIHRFMEKGVNSLHKHNSVFMVILKSFKMATLIHFRKSIKVPDKGNFMRLLKFKDMRMGVILLNVFVCSFTTVSVLSCLFAGYLSPSLRTTALSMSGIANGLGTIGLMLFIEPYNSILTDKVIEGTISEAYFRRYLTLVILARCIGTIVGQFTFIPLAHFIAMLASFV